jgi:type I restriction enzyme R subunit
MKLPNLAAALLARLLEDEVRARGKKSVVQQKKFSEMLEAAIQRYQSRTIESAQVIEELIELAKKMREADAQGQALALTKDEAAFYEALAENESAVAVLGDKQLAEIARQLTLVVKTNTSIDWTSKASVQAKLRLAVKALLKKTGYPPDGQEKATLLVLEQAKALGINLTGAPANDEAEGVSSMPPSTRVRLLPYPIAVFDALVQSQTEATLRVKTYRDGFEKALTFLASVALGFVTAEAGGKMPDGALVAMKQILGKPISMGTWYELAWRLAAMVPAASTDPAARALRALVTLEGKPSPLMAEVMTEVVEERNVFAHSVTPSSEEVALAEPGLMDLWRRFKKAVGALAEARLVVRQQLLDFDRAKQTWSYRARILEGGSDLFRVLDVTVLGELKEAWCYLLRDGAAPLSLAPLVFCAHSEKTSRHEVFIAREIASLEPGAKVDGVGVASAEVMRVG